MLVILAGKATLITICIIVLVVYISLGITGILQSFFIKRSRTIRLNKQKKIMYEFIFNFNKKEVTYFKRFESGSLTKMSFKEFYKMVPDARKLSMFKNYLNDLLYGSDKSLNSEIDIYLNGDNFTTFYFVQEMKGDDNIVHLVGYPISYTKPNLYIGASSGISIGTAYLRKHGDAGHMIYIRFFPFDKELESDKANIILNDLKTICMAFTGDSNSRQRLNIGDDKNGFAIIDYDNEIGDEYELIVNDLVRRLESRLEMSGYASLFDFRIGVARNNEFNDPEECLQEIRNVTYYQYVENNKVEWFKNYNDETLEKSILDKHELLQLIEGNNNEKKIESLYSPLIDVESCSLFGFYSKTVTYSTRFKTLNDMFDAAYENNLTAGFSEVLFKRLIGIYHSNFLKVYQNKQGKCPQRLFLQLSKYDVEHIFKILKNVNYLDECNIVFVLNEKILNDIVEEDIDKAFKLLASFKSRKYELCLRIKDRDLPWPNELYKCFDFFLFTKHINSSKERVETSTSLKAVLARLETFNKPIISIGVGNKSDLKLLYEKNIKILGGKLFGEPKEIIVPPNLSKINNLIQK